MDFYRGKHVLVTGHTGFKGAWMCLMLKHFGAEVTGFALPPEETSLHHMISHEDTMHSVLADIRNYEALDTCIHARPVDMVFHLAAQPLVRYSYSHPIETWHTNVLGAVHLFESARRSSSIKAIVNVTTDKCYENNEWVWPYRETDRLGGHDPYSASKACSEIVTHSYRKSFYEECGIGVASARAGNVIGGGDFSADRIIPDIVRALEEDRPVVLRSPDAVRPWQHVLDVLYGYALLGQRVYEQPELFSEAYNFSPEDGAEVTVEDITKCFIETMGKGRYEVDKSQANLHEATMLKLDSSKARRMIPWQPRYDAKNAVKHTALWYKHYLNGAQPIENVCRDALQEFLNA